MMANMGDGEDGRPDDGIATERVATPLVTALVTSEQGVFAVRRQARAVAAAAWPRRPGSNPYRYCAVRGGVAGCSTPAVR